MAAGCGPRTARGSVVARPAAAASEPPCRARCGGWQAPRPGRIGDQALLERDRAGPRRVRGGAARARRPGPRAPVDRALPRQPGRIHLLRHDGDPAQHRRGAPARPAALTTENTMATTLTHEQQEIRDVARQFLASVCTADALRAAACEPAGFNTAVWQHIVELGWPAMCLDDQLGGLGFSQVERALLMEEMGYA